MKKSVCIVNFGHEGLNTGFSTGFFCIIPYKNQKLKVLITTSFAVNDQIKNNKINIQLEDKIKEININDDRKIYLNEKYNTAMIEINPSKDGINDFLEIEENFTMENYEKENIYILHYLRSKCVSYGTSLRIEDHEFFIYVPQIRAQLVLLY